MIPILILAAGQSSRMGGRDKLLEDVSGHPLLRRQIGVAMAVGNTFVALGAEHSERFKITEQTGAVPVIAPHAKDGIGATLADCVRQLPQCDAFMVVLADLVALTSDDLRSVLDAREMQPEALLWRGATLRNEPGHPVIFSAQLRVKFADLHGDQGADVIARPLQDQTVLVPLPGDNARLDLDTPQDWTRWRARSN